MATISEKQNKAILKFWLRRQSLSSTLADVVFIILAYCKITDTFHRYPYRSICGAADIGLTANGSIFERIYTTWPIRRSLFGSFTAKLGGVYQWKLKIIEWPAKKHTIPVFMRIGVARNSKAEKGFMDALWHGEGSKYTWEFHHDKCLELKDDIVSIKLDLDKFIMECSVCLDSINIDPEFKDEGFRLGIATQMWKNTDNSKIRVELVSFDVLKYP